jgi:hypothetical protein
VSILPIEWFHSIQHLAPILGTPCSTGGIIDLFSGVWGVLGLLWLVCPDLQKPILASPIVFLMSLASGPQFSYRCMVEFDSGLCLVVDLLHTSPWIVRWRIIRVRLQSL